MSDEPEDTFSEQEAERWEEGHAQGVIDYMNRYEPGLSPKERLTRVMEMVTAWEDNPYREPRPTQPRHVTIDHAPPGGHTCPPCECGSTDVIHCRHWHDAWFKP